jgi:hypothetical protein
MGILRRFRNALVFEPPAQGLKAITIRAERMRRGSSPIIDRRKTAQAHQEWAGLYASTIGGVVCDMQTMDLFAQGITWEGDDQDKIAEVRDYTSEVDLEETLATLATEARIHGYGVAEIAKDKLGRYRPVPLSSINLTPVYDAQGWLDGFVQTDSANEEIASLPLSKCLTIVLTRVTNDVGLSQIARASEALKRHENISQASADIIWSHGYPAYDISITSPDGIPPADIPQGLESVVADLAPGSNISTGMASISELNQGGVPQIQTYGDWALQEVAVHMGVPRTYVGLIDNSEATAKVAVRAYYNRIMLEQKRIEREVTRDYLNAFVFPDLNIPKGEIKFTFNHPDPASALDRADYVSRIMALDSADPYALFDKNELAEMLGKHPKEGEYDDQDTEETIRHLTEALSGQTHQ